MHAQNWIQLKKKGFADRKNLWPLAIKVFLPLYLVIGWLTVEIFKQKNNDKKKKCL
jgi:hypothetical protein